MAAGDNDRSAPRRASCRSPAIRCGGGCSASWRAATGGCASSAALVGRPRPGLVPPGPAARRWAGGMRRSSADGRDATTASISRAAASCSADRRGAAPRAGTGAPPANAPGARSGAVPVHRQQRALADGRGAGRRSRRRRSRRQRRQPPQAAASQRGAGDARARHRHRRPALQAPRRVRRAALRLRRSACATACARSAPSSRPPGARSTGASPTRRGRATRRADLPRVRAHGGRARAAHPVPARDSSRRHA